MKELDLLALGRLASQEESGGEAPVATELEGSEIFEPGPFRHLGPGFEPNPQLVQILDSYIAVAHALDQMLADCRGHLGPGRDPGHSFPEDHASQFSS